MSVDIKTFFRKKQPFFLLPVILNIGIEEIQKIFIKKNEYMYKEKKISDLIIGLSFCYSL